MRWACRGGSRGITDDARPSAMSRRRLYPPYGWPTSQRHERHQAAEESSWTTSEINSKRCQIGESTGESTERVRSLQRTGLALGRGGLNFGTAENNCKTKPARARLWHSTVPPQVWGVSTRRRHKTGISFRVLSRFSVRSNVQLYPFAPPIYEQLHSRAIPTVLQLTRP